MDICYPNGDVSSDSDSPIIYFDLGGLCKGDIKLVIRELERIPDIALANPRAAQMLSLLKVQRDRRQDFETAQEAHFRECVNPLIAHRKQSQKKVFECGNAYYDCAPFATSEQFNRWMASAESDYR